MRFRDSHISISIGCSDRLKSHEVGYVKRCDLRVFLFNKVMQRHCLDEMGK